MKKPDQSVIDELKAAMQDVPFENSEFQNIILATNQETPARQYRHILLQADKKIKALELCSFRRRRIEIDIEEIKENIAKEKTWPKPNDREVRRLEIDLEEKELYLRDEIKLIDDAIYDVISFHSKFKELQKVLPEFSRLKFNEEEVEYWHKRLIGDATRQVVCDGRINTETYKDLTNIGVTVGKDEKNRVTFEYNPMMKIEKKD